MTVTLTDEMRLILPSATGGIVTIIPKPRAAGEYTPAQRGALDAQLDAAEKTPLHGPFKNGKEIAAYLTTFQARRSVRPGRNQR